MLKLVIILAVATVCCVSVHATNKYFLYTRDNPSVPEQIDEHWSLWHSKYFNRSHNTILLIHGHGGSANTTFNTLITYNILKYQEPHNIIVVDWEKDASYIYSIASARVPFVAYDLERFLNRQLAGDNLNNLNKVHLVGFGLGAHVAGIASRWVNLRDPNNVDGDREQVQRITGLDPSGSGWGTNSDRLRSTDANYVEVIHTDGSGIFANGIGTAIGDVNFYINGGSNQPGCLTNSCSHNLAYKLFAASMHNPNLVGYPCSSTKQMNHNECNGIPLNVGGTELYKISSSSIYRVITKWNYPY